MTDQTRSAPRRSSRRWLLLLGALAVAVFWLGATTLSVYAVTGSLLLGGVAGALALDRPAPAPPPPPRCRVCGCTDYGACLDEDFEPCAWADPAQTICTGCARAQGPVIVDVPAAIDQVAIALDEAITEFVDLRASEAGYEASPRAAARIAVEELLNAGWRPTLITAPKE